MTIIIGDWNEVTDAFNKAEAHLIETEKKHQIYHDSEIINISKVFDSMPALDYKHQINIALHLISISDRVYMLKGWEYNNDARMLHDYALALNLQIIYSKKF